MVHFKWVKNFRPKWTRDDPNTVNTTELCYIQIIAFHRHNINYNHFANRTRQTHHVTGWPSIANLQTEHPMLTKKKHSMTFLSPQLFKQSIRCSHNVFRYDFLVTYFHPPPMSTFGALRRLLQTQKKRVRPRYPSKRELQSEVD